MNVRFYDCFLGYAFLLFKFFAAYTTSLEQYQLQESNLLSESIRPLLEPESIGDKSTAPRRL